MTRRPTFDDPYRDDTPEMAKPSSPDPHWPRRQIVEALRLDREIDMNPAISLPYCSFCGESDPTRLAHIATAHFTGWLCNHPACHLEGHEVQDD